MRKRKLVVIGGGFAGFWSAMSAVRQSREIQKENELAITIVNPDGYLTIKTRLYEVAPGNVHLPLDKYARPLNIDLVIGWVSEIRPDDNLLVVTSDQEAIEIVYDYLILASGSSMRPPQLPGFDHVFNIDSVDAVQRLNAHLQHLAGAGFAASGAKNFLIVGGGLVGLQMASNIVAKARCFNEEAADLQAILLERSEDITHGHSRESAAYIETAFAEKDISVITSQQIVKVEADRVVLTDGREIATRTVIWTDGTMASSLTAYLEGESDGFGRKKVDQYLKLGSYTNVIVCGDAAHVKVDDGRTAAMACQYSNFQGRWAGHNAVNDLFDLPLLPYDQKGFAVCIDLGGDDALLSRGWDLHVELTGPDARKIKQYINEHIVYPPEEPEAAVAASFPEIVRF